MKIEFTKRFEKLLDKIDDPSLINEISTVVKSCIDATTIHQISSIKKLKGYKNYYRIRTGNYRIGISFEKNLITFCAFYNRKEFYRYFP